MPDTDDFDTEDSDISPQAYQAIEEIASGLLSLVDEDRSTAITEPEIKNALLATYRQSVKIIDGQDTEVEVVGSGKQLESIVDKKHNVTFDLARIENLIRKRSKKGHTHSFNNIVGLVTKDQIASLDADKIITGTLRRPVESPNTPFKVVSSVVDILNRYSQISGDSSTFLGVSSSTWDTLGVQFLDKNQKRLGSVYTEIDPNINTGYSEIKTSLKAIDYNNQDDDTNANIFSVILRYPAGNSTTPETHYSVSDKHAFREDVIAPASEFYEQLIPTPRDIGIKIGKFEFVIPEKGKKSKPLYVKYSSAMGPAFDSLPVVVTSIRCPKDLVDDILDVSACVYDNNADGFYFLVFNNGAVPADEDKRTCYLHWIAIGRRADMSETRKNDVAGYYP